MKSLFWAAVVLLIGGCKASAGGKINSGGDADAHASFEGEGEEEAANPRSAPGPMDPALGDTDGSMALLGARHDLFLKGEGPSAKCSCMRVFAGEPHAVQFSWAGPVPRIDPSSQLVVAFTSKGQVCVDEPPNSQGVAYYGYEKRGADVVVMVEAAAPGRPLVGGAILPRPDPGGRLLIRSVPESLPYGKPTDGAGTECEIRGVPLVATSAPAFAADPELIAVAVEEDDTATQEPLESLENDPNHPVDGSEEISRRRQGFYLGAIVGPGYLRLSSDTAVVSGIGFDFDLMIGGSPAKDLAIGVAMGGLAAPEPTFELEDGSEFDATGVNMNLVHFGFFADYYPIEETNFHALLAFGYDGVTYSGSGADAFRERADGFGVALGLGYDFWVANRWSLGFLGRVKASFVEFPDSSATGISPVLGFTATLH